MMILTRKKEGVRMRARPVTPSLTLWAVIFGGLVGCSSAPTPHLLVPGDCQQQMQERRDPVVPYQSGFPSADCMRRIERQNQSMYMPQETNNR
jgi:hypothetical protein